MKTIYRYKDMQYLPFVLHHFVTVCMFGQTIEGMELIEHCDDGSQVNMPFCPPVRVSDFKNTDRIFLKEFKPYPVAKYRELIAQAITDYQRHAA